MEQSATSSLSDETKAVCQLCAVPAFKNSPSSRRLLLLVAGYLDRSTKVMGLSKSIETGKIGVNRKHIIDTERLRFWNGSGEGRSHSKWCEVMNRGLVYKAGE